MDVETTYLLVRNFIRNIYVRRLKGKQNQNRLWKLLKPAYGLTGLGCLLYSTSHKTLKSQFGLERSKLGLLLHFLRRTQEMLRLAVHVDDYLYTGTLDLPSEFEKLLYSQFQIESLESGSLYIMRAKTEPGN